MWLMKYAYITKKFVISTATTTKIKKDAKNSRVRQMKMLVVFLTCAWLLKVGALMVETVATDVLPTLRIDDQVCIILFQAMCYERNVRKYLYLTTYIHVRVLFLNWKLSHTE